MAAQEQAAPQTANDQLAALMAGGQAMPAPEEQMAPPTPEEAAAAEQMAQQQQAPPAPDPSAELIARLAETERMLQELQAQLPDDDSKKVLQIAKGGRDAFEQYMQLKHMDLSSFSPMELLEMQYMEQKNDDRPYEEKREVFLDRMRLRFPNDFDPSADDYGLSPGALEILGDEAGSYRSIKEKEAQDALLKFETHMGEWQEGGGQGNILKRSEEGKVGNKTRDHKKRMKCKPCVSLTFCQIGRGTSGAGPLLVIAQKQRTALA